jgi:hypothetical protein
MTKHIHFKHCLTAVQTIRSFMALDGLTPEIEMLYLCMELWISTYFTSLSLLYWHFFRAVFIGQSQLVSARPFYNVNGKDLKPQLCCCHMWSNIVTQESATLCQYCVTFMSYCQLHIKRVPENGQHKLTQTAELQIFWLEHSFFFCMLWHLLLSWHCCTRLAKYGLH